MKNDFKIRIEREIKKSIKKIVEESCNKKGFYTIGSDVRVEFQKRINVFLNTEQPYIGDEFENLIEDIQTRISDEVKPFGFFPLKIKYFHNFAVLGYEFKIE